jgi:hypothetical protein
VQDAAYVWRFEERENSLGYAAEIFPEAMKMLPTSLSHL